MIVAEALEIKTIQHTLEFCKLELQIQFDMTFNRIRHWAAIIMNCEEQESQCNLIHFYNRMKLPEGLGDGDKFHNS